MTSGSAPSIKAMRALLICRAIGILACISSSASAAAVDIQQPPRLFPQLALGRTQIAFAHGGDIWMVPRSGGAAVRLTSGPEDDSNPSFSPDESRIAFSRANGDDSDVYVIALAGGATPQRLTFHPAQETVRDWTPDGTSVLFTSVFPAFNGMHWQYRLYTVPAAGGPSRELPIPIAWNGVFAPDGRVVYAPRELTFKYQTSWKGYRGGHTAVLALADLNAHTFKPLSSDDNNSRMPTWAGDQLLISSDRTGGIYNVFSVDLSTGKSAQVTKFADESIGALAGGPDGMAVYERGGRLFLLDPRTGKSRAVPLSLDTGGGEQAVRQIPAADYVGTAAIASTGEAAISTRSEILLIDAEGRSKNLTASSDATDQSPTFSPDGRRLAYISFGAKGDFLVLQSLAPDRSKKIIHLPPNRGGYIEPTWSLNGRYLTVTDLRVGLWIVDAETGSVRLADTGHSMNDIAFPFEATWSPDGEWLAYSRNLPNNNRAIFLANAASGTKYQLTTGEVDSRSPAFDETGKRLYFTTSGNAAASEAFGMYRYIMRPVVLRRIHTAELDLSQPPSKLEQSLSPAIFAKSIALLPFDQKDYSSVTVLADGSLLASVTEWPPTPGLGGSTTTIYRLSTGSPAKVIASKVDQFALTPDRSRLLIQSDASWSVRSLPAADSERSFTLDDVKLTINPREEWRQIYREAWRAMRDTFYDPSHHGQDVAKLEAKYALYLPDITRRADLTALLYLSLGNVSVSHIALDGGDNGPAATPPPTSGLLGADFVIDGDRFRFSRIYKGAPLTSETPTVGPLDHVSPPVAPGDYLLAINGTQVTAERDLQSYLLGTARQKTTLTISSDPSGTHARTIEVQPLASDSLLREAAWIENNREIVRRRSNDTLGYVYIPNYLERGIKAFLRQWISVSDKDGVVIDQRYNRGGYGVDLILDLALRRPNSFYAFRDVNDLQFPVISNKGPLVLMINERNGSAADSFPWAFKRMGAGPLVGGRTFGAGIGIVVSTLFTDGGSLQIPMRAFFNPEGSWDVENHGVDPTLPVKLDPAALLRGEDTQLNAAIDAALNLRREHPTPAPRHPPPFVYPRSDP